MTCYDFCTLYTFYTAYATWQSHTPNFEEIDEATWIESPNAGALSEASQSLTLLTKEFFQTLEIKAVGIWTGSLIFDFFFFLASSAVQKAVL